MTAARLVGDIGGTNARFALCQPNGAISEARSMRVAEHATLEDAIASYLGGRRPAEAVIAIATPVEEDKVKLTNSHWSFSQRDLAARFAFERLAVLNDFVAQALAVPALAAEDIETVGEGSPLLGHAVAVLGPGTGLGVAFLASDGRRFVPVASEGGHSSFAPRGARQRDVLAFLEDRFDHISHERVLSGPGLLNLAQALAGLDGVDLDVSEPKDVSQRARAGQCPVCAEAVRMFTQILGSFAGDMALMATARGGVFVVGALCAELGTMLDTDLLRRAFESKGRFRSYLARVPLHRVRRVQTGVEGCARFAFG